MVAGLLAVANGVFLTTAQIVSAMGALGAVISVLFWQLLKAKGEVTQAYKDVLPIATAIMETTRSLEKLVVALERDRDVRGVSRSSEGDDR